MVTGPVQHLVAEPRPCEEGVEVLLGPSVTHLGSVSLCLCLSLLLTHTLVGLSDSTKDGRRCIFGESWFLLNGDPKTRLACKGGCLSQL